VTNYVNYIQHVINTPSQIYRHYAYDIPLDEKGQEHLEKIKRIAISVLPLVSLYRPIGQTLSISMSGIRVVLNTSQMLTSFEEDTSKFCVSMMQVTLGVAALAGTVFHYKFCILLTNLADILQNLYELGKDIKDKKTENIPKDILRLASSISFMATLYYGSLEIVLVSYLVQVLLNAYLSYDDMQNGRIIEMTAKIAMGIARGYQANQTYQSIQRKNALLNNPIFKQIFERIKKAKDTHHLLSHHLAGNLEETVNQDDVELEGIEGEKYSAGAHYHGLGKGLVKGMNVALRTTREQGQDIIELDFKISHVHRDRLEKVITQMKNTPESELEEFLSLTNSQANSIVVDSDSIDEDDFWFFAEELFAEHRILIGGLGSIIVGASKQNVGSFTHVLVRMDHGKNLFDLYELLSLLDLEDALIASSLEDIRRLKLGHLYHTLFPRQALDLERNEEYFELSTDELQQEMIARAPAAKGMFARFLDKMELVDILPGRKRYMIPGLAEDVYGLGGRTLVTTLITDWWEDVDDAKKRIASILKLGLLSLETRRQMGMTKYNGLNGDFSDIEGGSDGIFTQMIPKSSIEENMRVDELMYSWFGEEIVFLIDLKAIETGTYQYHDDAFGTRGTAFDDSWWWDDESMYSTRDSILEFTREEERFFNGDNEVVIKERIAPEMIRGIIVSDEAIKQSLITYLGQQEVVVDGKIFGRDVDKFIHVTDRFSEELVSG